MNLEIKHLTKTYPNGVKALKKVDLSISNGMFGLLGPNGAGKSTLMRILATLQDADSGTVHYGELNVLNQKVEVKKILGYLPQDFDFYPKVRARNMLNHFAILKGLHDSTQRHKRIDELLEQVNLKEYQHRHVSTFSGGMKQRFGIAQVLLNNPSLIIVDEPTAGLDPAERVRFNNLLSDISREKIVILSTHIVDDVNDLCSEMAIIHEGKVLLKGNPGLLKNNLKGSIWKQKITREKYEAYDEKFPIISSYLHEGEPVIHVKSNQPPGDGFEPTTPTLEDVYFTAIKQAEKKTGNSIYTS